MAMAMAMTMTMTMTMAMAMATHGHEKSVAHLALGSLVAQGCSPASSQ